MSAAYVLAVFVAFGLPYHLILCWTLNDRKEP